MKKIVRNQHTALRSGRSGWAWALSLASQKRLVLLCPGAAQATLGCLVLSLATCRTLRLRCCKAAEWLITQLCIALFWYSPEAWACMLCTACLTSDPDISQTSSAQLVPAGAANWQLAGLRLSSGV